MTAWKLNLGSTPILNDTPSFLVEENTDEPAEGSERIVRFWESLLTRYGRHPYLLVRYADRMMELSGAGHALSLLEEAFEEMAALDAEISSEFQRSIDDLRERLDARTFAATETHIPDHSLVQLWIPAAMLPVPEEHLAPIGHTEVRSDWSQHFPKDSELFQRYMRSLVVETHQIDRMFLITRESAQDITQDRIGGHSINVLPQSKIQDPQVVEAILSDTLSAYDLVYPLVEDSSKLTPEAICEVHRRMMDSARFQGRYSPADVMRSVTRNEVFIETGLDKRIQCCPPERVEDEMYKICDLARRYIGENTMSPFAQAAWLHLAQVRCIPFEKGNGQTLRLISSIPLMAHGYPPISVQSSDREAYFEAISQAYKGDFDPLAQCFLRGMRAGITAAKGLDSQ